VTLFLVRVDDSPTAFQSSKFYRASLHFLYLCCFDYNRFPDGCLIFGETSVVDFIALAANLIESAVSLPIFYKIVVCRKIDDLMKVGLFYLKRYRRLFCLRQVAN
jgi:hypothetical protein